MLVSLTYFEVSCSYLHFSLVLYLSKTDLLFGRQQPDAASSYTLVCPKFFLKLHQTFNWKLHFWTRPTAEKVDCFTHCTLETVFFCGEIFFFSFFSYSFAFYDNSLWELCFACVNLKDNISINPFAVSGMCLLKSSLELFSTKHASFFILTAE